MYIVYIHTYTIYCISVVSVELQDSYYSFGSCQKMFCNIEYLDWLNMHFPALLFLILSLICLISHISHI